MEALLVEQTRIVKCISRLLTNMWKIGRDNVNYGVVKSRIALLGTYWTRCQELDDALNEAATAADRTTSDYFQNNIFDATEESYLNTMATLLSLEETMKPGGKAAPATPAATVRLPQIELPKFDGRYTEWENFHDLFDSLIATNASIPDVQKFHYLKTSLEGEARALLKNVTVTATNYATAWTTLKARYENKRLLVNAHLRTFTQIAPNKAKSATDLKRLLDETTETIEALKNLGRPTDQWDDWIVFVTTQKLDSQTRELWETTRGSTTEYPTFEELKTFLEGRARALEAISSANPEPVANASKGSGNSRSNSNQKVTAHHGATSSKSCVICKGSHALTFCHQYRKKPLEVRLDVARKQLCCFNCLRQGHMMEECPSESRCKHCQRKHHSLLHVPPEKRDLLQTTPNPKPDAPGESAIVGSPQSGTSQANVTVHCATENATGIKQTLLATARVRLCAANGRTIRVRALLDQGSESSFLTNSVAERLRAQRRRAHVTVSGLGGQPTNTVKSIVTLQMEPCNKDEPRIKVDAYVLQQLTTYVQRSATASANWKELEELNLADPDPDVNDPIDMLLGADLYALILLDGVKHSPSGELVAQNTIFGWILSGTSSNATSATNPQTIVLHCAQPELTDIKLHNFWELEEIPEQQLSMSMDDQRCEEHFNSTHRRLVDGTYEVNLPFKETRPLSLGKSLKIAIASLQSIERRLERNPQHAEMYHHFMREYLRLGHMTPAPLEESTDEKQIVYLPHHAVLRNESTTSPLRVVFNAASRTSNGKSLNDTLLAGPKLQADLFDILLRWRQYSVVFVADAEKMFRQIRVEEKDTDLQRIVWRPSTDDEIQAYRLLTVTYGKKCAPYLAQRVLKQLAEDERARYPAAARVLETDVYVDDLLTGASSIEEAINLRHELKQLLTAGGFHLRKWEANRPEVVSDEPPTQRVHDYRAINGDEQMKILGIAWNPHKDVFGFQVDAPSSTVEYTKRSVLSQIAKLYDPLGWLTPVVVTAKILMQEMWLRQLDWDDTLPPDLSAQWSEYCENLSLLRTVNVPRFVGTASDGIACEIHGFADASARAYAAVVYFRVLREVGDAQVTLITAKSKVAPVKQISIPRLELCAAHLLARLIERVQKTMHLEAIPVHAWTDSTVVLAWLRSHSSRWTTFVANRVANIQTRIPQARWRHVPTSDNPADCASRGILAQQMIDHSLWWTGPTWLQGHSTQWPCTNAPLEEGVDIEERAPRRVHVANAPEANWALPQNVSSWPKLLRITAYCKRFIKRLRNPAVQHPSQALTAEEIDEARKFWIKLVQWQTFANEITAIRAQQPIARSSTLRNLNPELDGFDVLRVGGRLRHSMLQYSERHPIILPAHPVSDLIIAHAHLRSLHGGPQLTIRVVRQQYWILGCRRQIRTHIHKCVICIRHRAAINTQQMGDLPPARTMPSRPFTHTGVDYAGPLMVRKAKGRGHQAHKAYVALFVCFATRAIHLELVDDYSSASFLAAFQRFTARRGIPTALYSDNGTTFHGADTELQKAFRAITEDEENATLLASDGTTWHFLPPAAPHFGGLWEAGVKAMKHHLRRIIGSHTLTSEEMTTLLAQVEACLNSRPLGPLNDDPDDLTALTPGHFLIGAPLKTIPEPSLLDSNPNRLSRWQTVRRLFEELWRRWQHEYLSALQQRHKWREPKRDIQPNELVLIRTELQPPSKWPLGRIIKCHPGTDGKTRVVTIRTATNTLQRPVTKICPLLIGRTEEDDIAQ